MFRHYDTAMKQFLTVKLQGKQVPLVGPVPPQIAFSRMRDLLKDDPRVKKDDKFVPLPFISFSRMSPVMAQERYGRADLRKITYTNAANRTTIARRPMPYDIPYQIDIWCEFEDDLTTLTEAFMRRWRTPVALIDVWHGDPYGNYRIGTMLTDIRDTSDLTGPIEDRTLRMSLTFTMEGFLSFPSTEVPTVRRIDGLLDVSNKPNTAPTYAPNTYEELLFTYTDDEDKVK